MDLSIDNLDFWGTLIVVLLFIFIIYIVVLVYYRNNEYSDDEYILYKLLSSIQSPFKSDSYINELKKEIDVDINKIINERINNKKLRDIALLSVDGGKRIRPIMAYSIVKKMKPDISNDRLRTVNSIEILHTASLMIDDMMDNDIMRRGKVAPHILYGNDITLLASSQMVIVSLLMISDIDMNHIIDLYYDDDNKQEKNKKIKKYKLIINSVLEKITKLIDGQTLDLVNDKTSDRKAVLDILSKKTSSIFEMIFMMSWILGGGDLDLLEIVDKLGIDFGIMFQIYDDFTDIIKDKNKNSNLNYVLRFGINEARNEFNKRKSKFIKVAYTLNIMTKEIQLIINYLTDVISINY